jgi:hypothetical protein
VKFAVDNFLSEKGGYVCCSRGLNSYLFSVDDPRADELYIDDKENMKYYFLKYYQAR